MKGHKLESPLPEDIIYDILLRSRVRSLIRLKSMGKRWLGLIESPPFVAAHLHRSQHSSATAILTVRENFVDDYKREFEYSISVLRFGEDTKITLDFHKFPFGIAGGPRCSEIAIAGSSNGLLCVCYCDWELISHVIVLWNPTTRQHWMLPSPLISGPILHNNRSLWGFEFVPETNDYKVLRFLEYYDVETHNNIPKAELFSWRTGSWKEIDNLPICTIDWYYSPVVLKGIWYQVVREPEVNKFILCFNFRDEIFWRIDFPPYDLDWNTNLFMYGNSLAMFADNQVDTRTGLPSYDIWLMKKDCWTKLFSNFTIMENVPSHGLFFRPLGFWETTIILRGASGERSDDLYLCDPLGRILTKVSQDRDKYIKPAINFSESLVSVPMS